MEKKWNCMRKSTGIALAALLVIAAFGILPAAAVTLPDWNNVSVKMANDARFDYSDDQYMINWTKDYDGLKAIYISDDYTDLNGSVYDLLPTVNNLTGTFYVTDTGGRKFQDNIILLVAVNSTSPNLLNLTISAGGYQWTPTGDGNAPPYDDEKVVYDGQMLEPTLFKVANFTENDGDVFQKWKPGVHGTGVIGDYPIFNPPDTYKLMFIDLWAGCFWNVTDRTTEPNLPDYGNVKVSYSILNNMPPGSTIVFNAYAWNNMTRKQNGDIKYATPGIRWTNDVTGTEAENANVWRVTTP